jgi:hypothetical protein
MRFCDRSHTQEQTCDRCTATPTACDRIRRPEHSHQSHFQFRAIRTLISAKAHYSDLPITFRHQIWQYFGIFAACRSHRSSMSVTAAFYADYIALFGLTLQELVIFGGYQRFISADAFTMFLLRRPHLPIGSATVWSHA